jgi:hypothetical protein
VLRLQLVPPAKDLASILTSRGPNQQLLLFRIRATMMAQAIGRLGNLAAPAKQSGTYWPRAIMVGLIFGEGDGARGEFCFQIS